MNLGKGEDRGWVYQRRFISQHEGCYESREWVSTRTAAEIRELI
jgi:hypothetical protein